MGRIDIEPLRLLRNTARLPNKPSAGKVGVALSTPLERIHRLCESGVIEGFHAGFKSRAVGRRW